MSSTPGGHRLHWPLLAGCLALMAAVPGWFLLRLAGRVTPDLWATCQVARVQARQISASPAAQQVTVRAQAAEGFYSRPTCRLTVTLADGAPAGELRSLEPAVARWAAGGADRQVELSSGSWSSPPWSPADFAVVHLDEAVRVGRCRGLVSTTSDRGVQGLVHVGGDVLEAADCLASSFDDANAPVAVHLGAPIVDGLPHQDFDTQPLPPATLKRLVHALHDALPMAGRGELQIMLAAATPDPGSLVVYHDAAAAAAARRSLTARGVAGHLEVLHR